VQSVLLYGSKTWYLTKAVLAQLEGFHVCAAYKMVRKYNPRKRLFSKWKHPSTKDVLKECSLHLVEEYIQTRCMTIAMYVVDLIPWNAGRGDVKEAQCRARGGGNRS
jgi:hypothetical protein